MSTATKERTEEKQQRQESDGQLTPAKSNLPAIQMGRRGMQLDTFQAAWDFATAVYKSGLAPKGIESPHAILIAVQMGAELGLPPMASLQNIAVINGRPSVWGDAMLAVCRGSGMFDEEAFEEVVTEEGDTLRATCTVRRLPRGKPVTRAFTQADAKKAGLWAKSGPWQQYPKRMLQLRARSWALRDAFADVLRGFHCAEEVRDVIDVQSKAAEKPRSLDALADRLEGQAAVQESGPEEEAEEKSVGEQYAAARGEYLAALADASGIRQCQNIYEARLPFLPEAAAEWAAEQRDRRQEEIRQTRGARANNPKPDAEPGNSGPAETVADFRKRIGEAAGFPVALSNIKSEIKAAVGANTITAEQADELLAMTGA